jgi:hypothetical protein
MQPKQMHILFNECFFLSKAYHRKEIVCLFKVIINIRHIPDRVKLRHFRRFFLKISQRYWVSEAVKLSINVHTEISHIFTVVQVPVQALYANISLLEHSCINNASKHFDGDFRNGSKEFSLDVGSPPFVALLKLSIHRQQNGLGLLKCMHYLYVTQNVGCE